MKNLSALALCFALMGVGYSSKSQAGISLMFVGGGTAMTLAHASSGDNCKACKIVVISGLTGFGVGLATTIASGVISTFNPVIGIPLLILSEDGSMVKEELENILTQKYNFISDREVISAMASAIKTKAENQKADKNGKILVSFTQAEVETILSPLDLTQEEKNIIISDLK